MGLLLFPLVSSGPTMWRIVRKVMSWLGERRCKRRELLAELRRHVKAGEGAPVGAECDAPRGQGGSPVAERQDQILKPT